MEHIEEEKRGTSKQYNSRMFSPAVISRESGGDKKTAMKPSEEPLKHNQFKQ